MCFHQIHLILSSPISYSPPPSIFHIDFMCSVSNLLSPFSAAGMCKGVCRSMHRNLRELTKAAFLRKSDPLVPSSCQLSIVPQLTLRLCEFLSLECRQLWSFAQSQSWVHESNGPVMSRSHGFTAVTLELWLLQSPHLLLQWSQSLGDGKGYECLT